MRDLKWVVPFSAPKLYRSRVNGLTSRPSRVITAQDKNQRAPKTITVKKLSRLALAAIVAIVKMEAKRTYQRMLAIVWLGWPASKTQAEAVKPPTGLANK